MVLDQFNLQQFSAKGVCHALKALARDSSIEKRGRDHRPL